MMPSKNWAGTSRAILTTIASKSAMRIPPSASDALPDPGAHCVEGNAVLRHGVAMADRDGPRRGSVSVDRDAERGAGFVHATVPAPDGAAVVVEALEARAQIVRSEERRVGKEGRARSGRRGEK